MCGLAYWHVSARIGQLPALARHLLVRLDAAVRALEILEERRAARRILLGARREVQQDLPAVFGDAQAQSTASRGSPACRMRRTSAPAG
jgi:hypothetical protein